MSFLCYFCNKELEKPRNACGVYFITLTKIHCYSCYSKIPLVFPRNDEDFVSRHHIVYHEKTGQKYSEDVIIDDILISIMYDNNTTTIYQYVAGGPTGLCTDQIVSVNEILDIRDPKIMEQIKLWITFN